MLLSVNHWEAIALFLAHHWLTLILGGCLIGLVGATLFPWQLFTDHSRRAGATTTPAAANSQSPTAATKLSTAVANVSLQSSGQPLSTLSPHLATVARDVSLPEENPVNAFAEGKRQNLPFMCPFMEAFKKAKVAHDAEKLAADSQKDGRGGDAAPALQSSVATNRTISSEDEDDEEEEEGDGEEEETEEALEEYGEEMGRLPVADTEELIRKSKESRSPEEVTAFYQHIPAHVKQLEQKKLFQSLDESELAAEREARSRQLADIFRLMETNMDTFGLNSLDEINDQMRLYVR